MVPPEDWLKDLLPVPHRHQTQPDSDDLYRQREIQHYHHIGQSIEPAQNPAQSGHPGDKKHALALLHQWLEKTSGKLNSLVQGENLPIVSILLQPALSCCQIP